MQVGRESGPGAGDAGGRGFVVGDGPDESLPRGSRITLTACIDF
jgi:hypothetical protein